MAPSTVDNALAQQTVGLVHFDEFQAKRRKIEDAASGAQKAKDDARRKKQREKKKAVLSFDGEDEQAPAKRVKLSKDPAASTHFLPDSAREAEEKKIRAELEAQFYAEHERKKLEAINVVFSYWDGSGHRASVEVKKGESIGGFLEKTRARVPQLKGVSVDNLMYIVDDLIIPQHHTFYEFLLNRTRGRTGLLFDFDQMDESRMGRVCTRSYYSQQKHVFPQSRWTLFDPAIDYSKVKEAYEDTRHYV